MSVRGLFFSLICMLLLTVKANAAIIPIDFETMPLGGIDFPSATPIPGSGGFTLSASDIGAQIVDTGVVGFGGGAKALSLGGVSITISRSTAFDLVDLVAGGDDGQLMVNGLLYGDIISSGSILNNPDPQFSNLKSYTFSSPGFPVFLDTIQFTDAAAVPEPATVSILGLGSIGMILRARRLRRRSSAVA